MWCVVVGTTKILIARRVGLLSLPALEIILYRGIRCMGKNGEIALQAVSVLERGWGCSARHACKTSCVETKPH